MKTLALFTITCHREIGGGFIFYPNEIFYRLGFTYLSGIIINSNANRHSPGILLFSQKGVLMMNRYYYQLYILTYGEWLELNESFPTKSRREAIVKIRARSSHREGTFKVRKI